MSTYTKARVLFNARPELLDVALETISSWTEENLTERFDKLLDESQPVITICGYSYSPSQVFRDGDSIAYRQELLAYVDRLELVKVEDYYFLDWELQDFIEQHTASEVV
jgi:hypothetical protein